MALYAYMQLAQQLLSDVKQEAVNPAFLISYINTARGQIAGDSECIRINGVLPISTGIASYAFSAISLGAFVGQDKVLNARMVVLTSGPTNVTFWPWEYFNTFFLGSNIAAGFPTSWTQYAQGVLGSLYFSPTPDTAYTANVDCVCTPSALVDDASVEALPYPWTDAVPYFAAYLALLSLQRQQEAANMYELYKDFAQRARKYSTPTTLPYLHEGSGMLLPTVPAGLGEMSRQAKGGA